MSKKIGLLLIAYVLVLISVTQVTAITNHNLEWGIDVGDQFHYTVSGPTYIGFPDYYVEINSVTPIPEDVSGTYDISPSLIGYSYYYENGTVMSMHMSIPWTVVPIGNWTLIQELMGTPPYGEYSWINTASEWGVTYTENWSTIVRTTTVTFSKTDGVLNLYRVVDDPEIGLTIGSQIVRKGVQSLLPILLIGGGVGIVVLAVIGIVYMKHRGKPTWSYGEHEVSN